MTAARTTLKAIAGHRIAKHLHAIVYLGYYGFAMMEGHLAHKLLAGGLAAFVALTAVAGEAH
jgi:hypothetical protein